MFEEKIYKGMINKSISYRLSIYISLAVITVFIGFILVSYIFSKDILKANIENKAIGQSTKAIMRVEKYVVSTKEITSNISEQAYYYWKNNDTELFISGILNKYHFLNAIHVNFNSNIPGSNFHNFYFFRNKNSLSVEKENSPIYHCKMEQAQITKMMDLNRPGWTEPFQCPRNKNLTVSFYSPIKVETKDGELKIIGDVVCELSLIELSDSINAIKFGNDGYAFLITQNGDYITHPREEWILKKNIYDLSDKVYNKKKVDVKKILERQKSGSTVAYPEIFNYKKSWVYYAPIKENGWFLIFNIPYNELFQPLYKNLLWMLLISVVGILVIYFTITYITNKLVEPLSTVTSQLRKFSNLSGTEDISSKSMNEVKVVSDSLNYMKSWYEKYKAEQSKELKKSRRQTQDLIQASEIQQGLIKTDFPAFPNRTDIDLYAIYKPARIVSGDLFDYFFIDDENLLVTMGDVSGKGVPAAIFMSVAQTIIKSNATYKKAKNIVNKANHELYTNNQHQFFLTLFLGVLNIKTGVLNYCNAAHTSTFVLKANGEIVELDQSHGLPLGLYPDKEYFDSRVEIENGDSIILYTDGVTETRDENNFLFGEERFKENVSHLTGQTPAEMVKRIEKSIDVFKGEAAQIDDISILILKYCPEKKA